MKAGLQEWAAASFRVWVPWVPVQWMVASDTWMPPVQV